MTLTVACVWVKGNVPYSAEYVARLQRMVARHVSAPYRFVCLTDRPDALPTDVESMTITRYPRLFGWWSKLALFTPGRFSGRVLYLDLDSLVVGSLDAVVQYRSSFALVPDAGQFQPSTKHRVVRRFNSSVMVWDADGRTDRIWDQWSLDVAKELWGDQDWIATVMPEADTMPIAWFPRLSAIQGGPVPAEAVVVLAKKPKPSEAALRWPWVDAIWRAA